MSVGVNLKRILETYGIKGLNPDDFIGVDLSQKEILMILEACDAVWIHDGDPRKPHVELTSGLCSNAYFNLSKVLQYPNIVQILAHQLTRKLSEKGITWSEVDWVVGSPYAAITFSFEVARQLGVLHGFCEKAKEDPKKMVWKRFEISEGQRVLQVEELITTSSTFRKVRKAIEEGNPLKVEFLPIIGTIVHRPPKLPVEYEIDREKIKIVALVEKEVFATQPEKCPLCKKGSKRLRPKENWKELTRKS